MTRKDDRSDAAEIHDLVQDINQQQMTANKSTTIPESLPKDTNATK